MIITRLRGGIGNQMFQYALGRVLSATKNVSLKVDVQEYVYIPNRQYDLGIFSISAEIAERHEVPFLYRQHKNKIIRLFLRVLRKIFSSGGKERSFSFDPKILSIGPNAYLDGYWQSYKYFLGYETLIKNDFRLREPLPEDTQKLMKDIEESNSVCLHVRRGDYVGNAYHDVVGLEYYKDAVSYLDAKAPSLKIFVFSDDIVWCKENLNFNFPTVFIDEKYAGVHAEGHLVLMRACRYFIIPNSTFSWWAAWLSNSPEKIVIAPKQWFADTKVNTSDLIPEDWIRL